MVTDLYIWSRRLLWTVAALLHTKKEAGLRLERLCTYSLLFRLLYVFVFVELSALNKTIGEREKKGDKLKKRGLRETNGGGSMKRCSCIA